MKRPILITATLAAAACAAEEPGRLPRPQDAAQVTVSAARRAPAVESFPAVVASERTAEIATRMSAVVERVLVDVGARVQRGDALLELDATDLRARIAAARAQEELAAASFRRVESLAQDGAASRQELDQATAGLEAARALRAEAEAQEAYVLVRAPFDGVVTRRTVDPGDLALPGQPLLVLVAPGALKVVADLPARRAGTLSAGGDVAVRVQRWGEARAARVTRVVPALGDGSRTFRVEAVFLDPAAGVIPGEYARLEVTRAGEGPRWVPADALVERGQLTGLFVVEADTLRLRWVRVGDHRDGAVELLAGPAGDVRVVRRPAADLFDGRAVASSLEESWSAPVASARTASGGEVVR